MALQNFYSDVDMNLNQFLKARLENVSSFPLSPQAGQIVYLTADVSTYVGGHPYVYNAVLSQWEDLIQNVANALNLKGNIDASTNPAYPSSPSKGDVWIVTVAGTVGGVVVEVGDQIIFDGTSWFTIQTNVVQATTTVFGYIKLATSALVTAGTDNTTAVTPLLLDTKLLARRYEATVNLVANTPLTVTHGLATANPTMSVGFNVNVTFYNPSGEVAFVKVAKSSDNAVQLTSNTALTGAKVVITI